MDPATAIFATVLAIFGGAVALNIIRGIIWGVSTLSSLTFAKTNELTGAIQPIAAFLKGPLESTFGKHTEFKLTIETVLLASVVFVLILAYGELSAMRSAAKSEARASTATANAGARKRD
jgi:hypothetical protein